MGYYLRYTENIEKDIELGCSYHYSGLDRDFSIEEASQALNVPESELFYHEEHKGWVQVLDGLCAFELEAETEEGAIEEARTHNFDYVYNTESMPFFHVLEADYAGDCPEGDTIKNIRVIYSNKY